MLAWVLKNKKISLLTVLGTFVMFLIVVMTFGPKLGFEFMAPMDDGKIRVDVESA